MTRRLSAVALVAVVILSAAGCAKLPGGSADGYKVTAYFSRAVALYPHSAVKVMGVDVGTTDTVAIEGGNDKCDLAGTTDLVETDCIRVTMTINKDIPLPTDIEAMIVPLTLIGERNVVLSPPWKKGDKLADGAEIDVNHTGASVEPDDALQAFTDLARAIDPENVSRLVTGGAQAVNGKGETFNDLLTQTAGVTETLASQDDRIIEVASNLHQVVAGLNTRDVQVGRLIDSLAQASGVLAEERSSLSSLLSGAVKLTDVGNSLLTTYKDQLPADINILTKVGYVLEANLDTLLQLVAAFPVITQGLQNAWYPSQDALLLSINVEGTVDVLLNKLLALLGIELPPLGPLCDLIPIPLPPACP